MHNALSTKLMFTLPRNDGHSAEKVQAIEIQLRMACERVWNRGILRDSDARNRQAVRPIGIKVKATLLRCMSGLANLPLLRRNGSRHGSPRLQHHRQIYHAAVDLDGCSAGR